LLFFTAPAPTEIYTLSLHDALPIFKLNGKVANLAVPEQLYHYPLLILDPKDGGVFKIGSNGTGPFILTENKVSRKQVYKPNKNRSEEHTSELQSRGHLVCRLLLEKK